MTRGVLTLGIGRRHAEMALSLARSLRRHDPSRLRAVVTDSADRRLLSAYDRVIRPSPEGFPGFGQKLLIDSYSPYDETLFLDADCLVVRPLDGLFALLERREVGVIGAPVRGGDWYMDVAAALARRGLEELPKFNGGVYFVRRGPGAAAVYATAREIAADYERQGLRLFRGSRADEPVMALALAWHGVAPVDDGGRGMATPIAVRGRLRVDVLGGACRFNKGGRPTEPAVIHFTGPWAAQRDPRGAFYRRERRKLALAERGARAASLRARLRFGTACAVGTAAANAGALGRGLWQLTRRQAA